MTDADKLPQTLNPLELCWFKTSPQPLRSPDIAHERDAAVSGTAKQGKVGAPAPRLTNHITGGTPQG